eukprot:1160424-Pelagomonas_calceolata.AAC.5
MRECKSTCGKRRERQTAQQLPSAADQRRLGLPAAAGEPSLSRQPEGLHLTRLSRRTEQPAKHPQRCSKATGKALCAPTGGSALLRQQRTCTKAAGTQ